RLQPPRGVRACDSAPRLPHQPAGAEQQSCQPGKDHHHRIRNRSAGDAVCGEPDLVGRAQRAGDDECAAGDLRGAGGRGGLCDGALGAGDARPRLHAVSAGPRACFSGGTLPVLEPFRLGAMTAASPGSPLTGRGGALLIIALLLSIGIGEAHAAPGPHSILATLLKWTPLLARGFALNIAMSFLAMAFGTVLGLG